MNAQALNAPALPLQDRIVLVTGATGGIGDAIVERLAAEGARPIIHFARNEGAAKALLNRIDGRGWIVQADLTTREGPEKLWSAALQHAGHVDALINNAGIRSEIPVTADTETWQAAWEREFRINFFAAADLCRLAIRHFQDRSGGSIVNMASRAGQRGYAADAMPYGASKAALINLTKSIARSFGASGITAIAIAPGWVRTAMAEDFIATHGEAAAVSDIPIGACHSLVEAVLARHGRIDILVNNAGINRRGNLLSLTDEDWRASFAVNLDAMFHLCRAALPGMIRNGGGAIVNTASQWGLYPAPNHIAYNVTKAAVAAFTQNLARDYAPDKIRVNAVCPGEIHTPMLEAGVKRSGRTIADLDKLVPFGRIGKPEEVAALVAFLASDEAAFMCGSLVEITGAQAVA